MLIVGLDTTRRNRVMRFKWNHNTKTIQPGERITEKLDFHSYYDLKIELYRFKINWINIPAELIYQVISAYFHCLKSTEVAAIKGISARLRYFQPISGLLSLNHLSRNTPTHEVIKIVYLWTLGDVCQESSCFLPILAWYLDGAIHPFRLRNEGDYC